VISRFSGEYRFLSNFYAAPFQFGRENSRWPTVEHAFQAAKTLDQTERQWVLAAETGAEAKKRGRQVTRRSDWDYIRKAVMLRMVLAKFSQHQDLAVRLVATGDKILVEGNTWGDDFWGAVNRPAEAGDTLWGPVPLAGKNWLGRILMMVRDVMV
jgi:ribA/ribD-fused uncharacterized protein